MTANLLLSMLSYSSSLTFSVCTLYTYLFFLINSLSAGATWVLHFKEIGSGGNKKGLNEIQEIAILATCVMYVLLFIWNMRTMRKFRKSGGPLGLDKSEGIFEDKIISCVTCCFNKGT
jgi:uncharacterized membrane protein